MFYRDFSGFFNHSIRVFFFTIILIIISAATVSARQVTLTWEPNSEPDLSHYIVYWGTTSGNYTSNSGNIGMVTEYSVTIPDEGQYFFAVTAVDEAGLESDFSNEVFTEEGSGSGSLPPVANAGTDQTKAEGQVVTLNGSASSDPDGSIVSYNWTQTGGTAVTLSSATTVQPSFTAPNVGPSGATLTFSLTVTDTQGLQSTDSVNINVTWVNAAPTANAGPDQTKAEGLVVTLNGSGSSDPDGSTLTYLWTQTGGTAVTLSSATTVQPSFTAPNVGPSG
ncbi:MAG: hypothetical protein GX654_07205, partial [Desulfatiglans sp.]|nr:hypothetical protein [Desulfatiglans sp.]